MPTTPNLLAARRFSNYQAAFDCAVGLGISATPHAPDTINGWVVTVPDFTTGNLVYIAAQ